MPRGFWWIVEIAALVAYILSLVVTFSNYSALPATIPTHFGLAGTPDGYGDKSTILFVVATSSLLFGMLTMVPFFPNLINMPGPRTPETIAIAIAMLRVLKVEVMGFLAYLVWAMVETAMGARNGLGGVAPLVFVFVLLSTTGIGMYRSTRNAN